MANTLYYAIEETGYLSITNPKITSNRALPLCCFRAQGHLRRSDKSKLKWPFLLAAMFKYSHIMLMFDLAEVARYNMIIQTLQYYNF